jgi:outer membrane murein-binding lipoprotein Lpp
MKRIWMMSVVVLAGTLGMMWVTGCGKKANADKPMADVQKEVASMSSEDLRKMADAYHKEIVAMKKPSSRS